MVRHARKVGGAALRALTFHQRADLLKRLAAHLTAHKDQLYKLSYDTGATLSDSRIDIDGECTSASYSLRTETRSRNTAFTASCQDHTDNGK